MDVNLSNYTCVTVVVPCRNEVGFINHFIDLILEQNRDNIDLEIIIADGMSDDGTREILQSYAEVCPCLRVIENKSRIVSTGLNDAIKEAKGEIIVRMDVHTEYAKDYIQQCIKVLNETGADSVGGPWEAVGKGYLQEAIALAFQSPFSSGGSSCRKIGVEGPVDTVYLGCWKKQTLIDQGLFDEELVRNQDDELSLRIVRSGGKIWQSPKIKSRYYPRASIKDLFRQYMQYGFWKVYVIRKHKTPASVRHVVPGGFVASLIILPALIPFTNIAFTATLAILGLYLMANLFATVFTCSKPYTFKYIPIMPIIFAVYHAGYGYGFLCGVLRFTFFQKHKSLSFEKLTR